MATVTLVNLELSEDGPGLAERIGSRFGLRLDREDKARKTTARIALEGGLIESLTGHVVGSASTTQSKEIEKYSGDTLAQLIVTDPGSRAVQDSPLGDAIDDALLDLVVQFTEPIAALNEIQAPAARPGAPDGLRFTKSTYDFDITRTANQWVEIEVHNTGSEPRAFLLRADSPEDLIVGFMGNGSEDAPAIVPPGAWKQVRLVFTADWSGPGHYDIPIHLYDVTDKAASDRIHDTSSVTAEVLPGNFLISIDPVGKRTSRLGQRYRISNLGSDTISDLSIRTEAEVASAVRISPAIDHYPLAPGENIEVTIEPRLNIGFQEWHGAIDVVGLGQRQPLSLSFRVPPGHEVFLAEGSSRNWFESLVQFCTNVGEGAVEVGDPYSITKLIEEMRERERECKRLRDLIDRSEARQDHYGNARDRAIGGRRGRGVGPIRACPESGGFFGHEGSVPGDPYDVGAVADYLDDIQGPSNDQGALEKVRGQRLVIMTHIATRSW